MKYVYLLPLLLTISCGPAFQNMCVGNGVDSSVQPFVASFEASYGRHIDNFPITLHVMELTSAGQNPIGECIRYSNGQKEILIDPIFWNNPTTTDFDKEEVVFHELGHCQLGLVHNTNTMWNNYQITPVSIMYPYHFPWYVYSTNRTYYINQLFSGN